VADHAGRARRLLLFNTSKQAINPGPIFGPYGLPKAGPFFWRANMPSTTAPNGIRANAVNGRPHPSGLLRTP